MTIKQFSTYALAGLILGGLLYMKGCLAGRKARPDSQSIPAVLKPNEKEQVLIDPVKHVLTVVTKDGVTRTVLSDRLSTITERSDGTLVVNTPQFGYEQRSFIGGGFTTTWRMAIGCDMFFFKRLDLGPLITFESSDPLTNARVGVILSYTVLSNTRVGLSIDHLAYPGLFITVRL